MSNDPNQTPGVCPECGGTSEDFFGLGKACPSDEGFYFDWECPCGALLSDDDLLTLEQYKRTL